MASTYTTNTGIEKPGTGDQSGTWGTTTNTNFDIIDRALNGVGTITLSGTTHTLSTTDGTLSDGMYKVLVLGGSPSGTNTITVDPNTAKKVYYVINGSGQDAVFSQGSGSNVTVTNGKNAIIYCDGGGTGGNVVDITASFNFLTDVVNDTTPQLGGSLASNGNDINMADSDNINVGNSSDLQIYHNATDSFIENNTGELNVQGDGITLRSDTGTETYITMDVNDGVDLYFDNTKKFETTTNGVTVSGSAVAANNTNSTATGNVTLDFGSYQNFILTLTGNLTLDNPTTEQVGQSGFIAFIQDATGGRTLSLGTDYETAGGAGITLSTAASATDLVPYVVVASGRILLGAPQLAFS